MNREFRIWNEDRLSEESHGHMFIYAWEADAMYNSIYAYTAKQCLKDAQHNLSVTYLQSSGLLSHACANVARE